MRRARHGRSLARRLFLYLFVPTTLVIAAAAALAAASATRSVDGLYDGQMRRSAETLLAFLHYELLEEYGEEEHAEAELGVIARADGIAGGGGETDDGESAEEIVDELVEIVTDIEARQGTTVDYRLSVDGRTLFTSALVSELPPCGAGFRDFRSPDGERWRCYGESDVLPDANRILSAEFYEPEARRRAAIRSLVGHTFRPLFALPVLLFALTAWAVTLALGSIRSVSAAVAERSVDHLERLPRADQPQELLPVVDSVNELLAGIERGVAREKRFTDDAAHELRTPLTSIGMLEQLMRRDNADPALVPHLDALRAGIRRSDALIGNLLALARLQSAHELPRMPVDIGELLRERLGLLAPQLAAKDLGVEIVGPGGGEAPAPRVDANEEALALLLDNLLGNAIKYGPEGGTVHIVLEPRTLRIEDDGPGVAAADAPHVFERFYRAERTRAAGGTGLGLALARRVAELHGFDLSIGRAVRGRGASFRLRT